MTRALSLTLPAPLLRRYIFKDGKKVGLQEIGPRFTLKLRSLQKGTFDSKFGEFEFVHNVCFGFLLVAAGAGSLP